MGSLDSLLRSLRDLVGNAYLLDRLISQSEVVDVGGGKVVKKRFVKEVGVIKWLPPTILLRGTYPFTLNPKERFSRELDFFTNEVWEGVKVPEVIAADEEVLEIVREYVDGKPLDYRVNADLIARTLAEIHCRGRALGDVKPTNFLVTGEGTLYVIDAEQSVRTTDRAHWAWDIALTMFFASYANLTDLGGFRRFVSRFVKSYVASGGLVETFDEILTPRFSPLTLLMPLPHLFAMVDEVNKNL